MSSEKKYTSADLNHEMIAVMKQETLLQQRLIPEVFSLQKTITEFKDFYNFEDDYKARIPYPYRVENQAKYNILSVRISSALEMVEFVLSDMKKRMFELERNQSSNDNFNMQSRESTPQPEVSFADQPQPNRLQRMFGVKKKKIVNKNDPYQSSIPFFKIGFKIIDKWGIHKNWQSINIIWDEDELSREGYNARLVLHKSLFADEVETDILWIYQKGLSLRKLMEKQSFINVLQKSLTEQKQQEQQQFPQR